MATTEQRIAETLEALLAEQRRTNDLLERLAPPPTVADDAATVAVTSVQGVIDHPKQPAPTRTRSGRRR